MARRLIDVAPAVERVLIVGAPRKGTPDWRAVDEHLDELARLAGTAGARVAGRIVQAVRKPTPDFYVGRGKVDEIVARAAELGATMVVFDEDLTPAQGKNLEERLKVRIMDRTELILDIFALRARSREARMQVELAQLEYTLTRLTRMWVHLSRIRGGIGLRGPGETQLETDRRAIRHRIGVLRKKLAEVAAHRGRVRSRAAERGVVRVALVGYTNAGKSSLLRALTGAQAHVEDRLFATLDTQSREVELEGGGAGPDRASAGGAAGRLDRAGSAARGPVRVRYTDTVGLIRKLPHGLVASFRATLEEALSADVLVHVVDVSHPDWEEQAEVVHGVLAEAGLDGRRRLVVALNKADRLDGMERERRLRAAQARGWEAVLVSAVEGTGLEALRDLAGRAPGG